MRYVRFGPPRAERPGALDGEGRLHDLSAALADIDPETIAAGLPRLDDDTLAARFPRVEGTPRLGSPVARPGKIVCVGLNYRAHIAEVGASPPREPVLFLKAPTALAGPADPVVLPSWSLSLDWEVELAMVVGTRIGAGWSGSVSDAVAGFAIANDLSDRSMQLDRGGQWTKGKSADGFCPLGPWLVTPDAVADPQTLGLTTRVNGVTRQEGSTADLVFGLDAILAYIGSVMTLLPGDLVLTGTPAGCAMGMAEPAYLKAGDVMELAIDGLGRQRTLVEAAR
ncbi:fumarylacetoacetate hydrolase family protein [Salinarimonas ramus]|uniref:2-keto-4-pentenoate hydratase n=1 Tax=Salinarimonas ramus TaxID=690164 RepID=A0A917QJE0_9HYPH|nr:fumarylacetoacetate hydrolase family protein [Salinarimonas ramus]GGK53125.1 2-keto-4-pentenoate hydratase [Salinarimonas ramus]